MEAITNAAKPANFEKAKKSPTKKTIIRIIQMRHTAQSPLISVDEKSGVLANRTANVLRVTD